MSLKYKYCTNLAKAGHAYEQNRTFVKYCDFACYYSLTLCFLLLYKESFCKFSRVIAVNWQACDRVVKYVKSQLGVIRFGLDGKNIDVVLTEFGIRFHRVVYDHLLQFQFNSFGLLSSNIITVLSSNMSLFFT